MEENIQLRWKLQEGMMPKGIGGKSYSIRFTDGFYVLQFRFIESVRHEVQWSEWKDVPTVQE